MPGRFKDYIAMPKANLYQSLHTTVVRPNGAPAEIQIRTSEMHRVCEYGVAAHWTYKEKSPAGAPTGKQIDVEKFSWLHQIMELQHDVKDPNEFLAAVKVDLFEEEIFVFTPRGDVIQLSVGSTPLDFAFAVHTNIGLRTVGAKVNGRILPLRGKLQSGDIVEILTSAHQKPSKDWLHFVNTSRAKNKIRSFLRNEQRNRSKKLGAEILREELSKRGFDIEKMIKEQKTDLLAKAAKEGNLEDLYLAVGYGRVNPKELILKVFPEEPKKVSSPDELTLISPSREVARSLQSSTGPGSAAQLDSRHDGILVSGLDHLLVTFGRCCNPLPGEDITGFITRGRGVSVHRMHCPRSLDLDPERRVPVSWAESEKQPQFYKVFLRVLVQDRQGVLADVTTAISRYRANIYKAQVNLSDQEKGILDFEIGLKNIGQLQELVKGVEMIPDVILVERRSGDKKLFK